MRRLTLLGIAFSAALFLCGTPLIAQRPGGGGGGMGGGAGMGRGPGMEGSNPNNPNSRMGRPGEMSTPMSKTPAQMLAENAKLSQKLAALLPAGTNMQEAAQGFKNLGEFVAAVHVSHNLDIHFFDLKAKMATGKSLGKAIHDLKPDASAKDEEKRAKKQAKDTIRETKS